MTNSKEKLIKELEEDGFCEEPFNSETVLSKNFKYSRPVFWDSDEWNKYKIEVHILGSEITTYGCGYISKFFLDMNSIKNIEMFISCIENSFLFYSIYNKTFLSVSIHKDLPFPNDITKYYIKVDNHENIFLKDEDFENKFFLCLNDQIKKMKSQTEITKAILEHISIK